MSTEDYKPRTVLKLNGLKLVDTAISTLPFASIYYRFYDNPIGSISALLQPDDDALALAPHLATLTDIAIVFPVFTDGRGYSQAAQLRKRLAYTGRLRAVGDVLVDQVNYMARAGFDEIELREDQSIDAARKVLTQFSAHYQAAQDGSVPVWQRAAA
jgi:uncharacterized protein (DUF934 family)